MFRDRREYQGLITHDGMYLQTYHHFSPEYSTLTHDLC